MGGKGEWSAAELPPPIYAQFYLYIGPFNCKTARLRLLNRLVSIEAVVAVFPWPSAFQGRRRGGGHGTSAGIPMNAAASAAANTAGDGIEI